MSGFFYFRYVYRKPFILIIFSLFPCISFAKDYTDYHKAIIKAERQIFVSNQVDSGLNTYIQVFKEFDFVFLHDCVTAMCVALEFNNEKAFKVLIDKATKNGFLERHLNEKTKFKTHPIYIKNKSWIDNLYTINRSHYLKRLDTTAIKRLYTIFENDQCEKNGLKRNNRNFSIVQDKRRYGPIIRDFVIEIKKLTAEKGWLSDKIVGIDQKDIFKELRLKGLDLMDYYVKHKATSECVMTEGQFTPDEWLFSSTLIMPILIHHRSQHGSGNLYDTTFYKQQIALGYMHPKDFAMINDTWHFSGGTESFRKILYFGVVGGGTPWTATLSAPDTIINRNRVRFFIAPVEQDKAKWKFLKEHKWSYNYGFWGCRS